MSDIQVHYIATKNRVIDALKTYCARQDIHLTPYDHHLLPEISYLLIVEPVEIGTELFALSTIWKPWLMEKGPDVKLFFAGYGQSSHANYLNLLELPSLLKNRLENGYPVSAYLLQKTGTEERAGYRQNQYEDPWYRLLPLTGRDMKKQMQKFVDGHDPGHSFDTRVSRLRKALVDIWFLLKKKQKAKTEAAKSSLEEDLSLHQKEAEEEWELLFSRWNFYKKYFDWMPFKETTKDINEIMESLKDIMSNAEPVKEFPKPDTIDTLRKLVHNGLERYANFEKNW